MPRPSCCRKLSVTHFHAHANIVHFGSIPQFRTQPGYYRTPLHILDDGSVPAPFAADASSGGLAQFRKRTVSKFRSAFLYYLTHDLAHLQNILLFDGWLAALRAAQRELVATRLTGGHVPLSDVGDGGKDATRSVYIPRAMV